MTLEDAQKLGEIICVADGGCSFCVGELMGLLNNAFTEFEFYMEGVMMRQPDWSNDPEDARPFDLVNARYRK